MATIRKWLTEAGFDFDKGRILWQDTGDEDSSPGWHEPVAAVFITNDHAVLDREFSSGYGGPECPRFMAEDARAYYFPSQYDGATGIEVLVKDLNYYLDIEHSTLYPGG